MSLWERRHALGFCSCINYYKVWSPWHKLCRIIEPLASRCAKFRFKPLPQEVMSSRILYICEQEGLNLEAEVLMCDLISISSIALVLLQLLILGVFIYYFSIFLMVGTVNIKCYLTRWSSSGYHILAGKRFSGVSQFPLFLYSCWIELHCNSSSFCFILPLKSLTLRFFRELLVCMDHQFLPRIW